MKMRKWIVLGGSVVLLFLLSKSTRNRGEPVWITLEDKVASVQWFELKEIEEPSGIVFVPQRGTLFVIGDEGDVAELSTEMKILKQKRLTPPEGAENYDLEGVTYNPANNRLYVVVEGDDIIFELHPETLIILRKFPVDRSFGNEPEVIKLGGDGIEGITFVPDASSPEGGFFYAVNQREPPLILKLSIPILSSVSDAPAKILQTFTLALPVRSLNEIQYDPAKRIFYILTGFWNTWYIIDEQMNILFRGPFPGLQSEGLTFDDAGKLYIAEDVGGVVKISFRSPIFPKFILRSHTFLP